MNLKDKRIIKNIAMEEIALITNEISILEEQLKPVEKVCSLDGYYHESLNQEQIVLTKRYKDYVIRLEKLKATLQIIDNDDYGICQECNEDILIDRLKLVPESTYCVKCINELGSN